MLRPFLLRALLPAALALCLAPRAGVAGAIKDADEAGRNGKAEIAAVVLQAAEKISITLHARSDEDDEDEKKAAPAKDKEEREALREARRDGKDDRKARKRKKHAEIALDDAKGDVELAQELLDDFSNSPPAPAPPLAPSTSPPPVPAPLAAPVAVLPSLPPPPTGSGDQLLAALPVEPAPAISDAASGPPLPLAETIIAAADTFQTLTPHSTAEAIVAAAVNAPSSTLSIIPGVAGLLILQRRRGKRGWCRRG